MKFVVRLLTVLFLLAGGIVLIQLSIDNRELGDQIDQLEAELGRMSIDDRNRVHLVEIETPDVPPEVASHLERVWQFRCYLPPGYDVIRFSGGGRVAKEGVYLAGGYSSGWGSPGPVAIHQLFYENGIPPIVGAVRIPAGRHRVTLHTGDSPSEEFCYVVYVDGKQAFEETMGSDWMPGGWSSASSMSWPREPNLSPPPLQLSAKSYQPKLDFAPRVDVHATEFEYQRSRTANCR